MYVAAAEVRTLMRMQFIQVCGYPAADRLSDVEHFQCSGIFTRHMELIQSGLFVMRVRMQIKQYLDRNIPLHRSALRVSALRGTASALRQIGATKTPRC